MDIANHWIGNLKARFEQFFRNGFKPHKSTTRRKEPVVLPSIPVSEKDRAFEVTVAVPGLDKEDVHLEVQNDFLIISAEKQYEKRERNDYWVKKELGLASFKRMFRLPADADPDAIDVSIKNGVLDVAVGKRQVYRPQQKVIIVN